MSKIYEINVISLMNEIFIKTVYFTYPNSINIDAAKNIKY